MEAWASRVTAAKRQTDQYFCVEDVEGEGGTRLDFLCPFCYMDFDIASLCCHVEDEHCLDTSTVACPVCTTLVGSDIVGHITRQHSHLFKGQRRRRYPKGGAQPNSALGRERAAMGGGSSRLEATIGAADPLLSSFICGLPSVETDEQQKAASPAEESLAKDSSDLQAAVSANLLVPDEESKQTIEEGMQRAEFVQQLVLSTILPDEF
uniref:TSA: Wollemia nobilis Ref_Wollemi_Transcript_15776_1057 transcribed RNA sequence n=1 Tax=Wollemia nobilis TaxID=56998 RepID=A0A0C9RIN3_9CONI